MPPLLETVLGIYYACGIAYCVWEFGDFHKRLDKKYPLTGPAHWNALEVVLVPIGAAVWPVLLAVDSFVDSPVGHRNR